MVVCLANIPRIIKFFFFLIKLRIGSAPPAGVAVREWETFAFYIIFNIKSWRYFVRFRSLTRRSELRRRKRCSTRGWRAMRPSWRSGTWGRTWTSWGCSTRVASSSRRSARWVVVLCVCFSLLWRVFAAIMSTHHSPRPHVSFSPIFMCDADFEALIKFRRIMSGCGRFAWLILQR